MRRSVRDLEAAARADSNDASRQFNLALAHWKRRHWREADSLLRLSIRLDPWFAEAYLGLSHLPFSRRSSLSREVAQRRVPKEWRAAVDEAHRFYQQAFRIDPFMSQRLLAVAYPITRPYFEDVNSAEARLYYLYYAWMADLGQGRYQDAYGRLSKLTFMLGDSTPDFILWYRAISAAHIGWYPGAAWDVGELLKRAEAHEERDSLLHVPLQTNDYRFMLAVLSHRAEGGDRAIELYRQAVQHDLGLVMAHVYMAMIYDETGRPDSALIEHQRAAEAGEDDPAALFDYATALFNAKRFSEAEPLLTRAVTLNPRYAAPHYLLGRVYEQLGRTAAARDAYTQFLSVAPQSLNLLIQESERRVTALP